MACPGLYTIHPNLASSSFFWIYKIAVSTNNRTLPDYGDHFAFKVENTEEIREKLEASGIAFKGNIQL